MVAAEKVLRSGRPPCLPNLHEALPKQCLWGGRPCPPNSYCSIARPRARRPAPLIFTALLVALMQLPLHAQEARVTASVDKQNVSIGDWITLHLEVTGPADLKVVWPSFPEALKGFEIVRQEKGQTARTDRGSTASINLVLTAFEEGKSTIPALSIECSTPKGSAPRKVETTPIAITVRGVQVDTTKDIKDIKPPVSLRITFREALPYLLGALGFLLLGWLVYYVRKKRRRGETILPQAPPRPPHEVALEALRVLEAEKLWQQGREKEYHARLSDILRTYIEDTLEIPAMEMTTTLIVSAAPVKALDAGLKDRLREILERSDLVKFAKFRPVAEEHKGSMDAAVWFVQRAQNSLQAPAEAL